MIDMLKRYSRSRMRSETRRVIAKAFPERSKTQDAREIYVNLAQSPKIVTYSPHNVSARSDEVETVRNSFKQITPIVHEHGPGFSETCSLCCFRVLTVTSRQHEPIRRRVSVKRIFCSADSTWLFFANQRIFVAHVGQIDLN